ncbi:hypothetical protein [Coralloluteibacterium stylophorae]|uniref:Serine/threonine protein kinase n=1 Tax=Coralloluteibacterium stylophorae TaxID=1776034 RepID=A0A8J7VXD3_9GAMM|nr:hypothetical protein [Coralloluteibacterium stylophorae]MBS7455700.1 hypothetical protein [Coralloluteibacterium stylophorae]
MHAPTASTTPAPRAPVVAWSALAAILALGVAAPAVATDGGEASAPAYRALPAGEVAAAHAPGRFDACGIRFDLAPDQFPDAQGDDFVLFDQVDDGEVGAVLTCLASPPADPDAALRAYTQALAGSDTATETTLDTHGGRYRGLRRRATPDAGQPYEVDAWYLPSTSGGAMLMLFTTPGPVHVAARDAFRARLERTLATDAAP